MTLRHILQSSANLKAGSNLEKTLSVLTGLLIAFSAVNVVLSMSFLLTKVLPHMKLEVESIVRFSQSVVM
jgi:hypothetical protein